MELLTVNLTSVSVCTIRKDRNSRDAHTGAEAAPLVETSLRCEGTL